MRTRRIVDQRPNDDYPWRLREGRSVAPGTFHSRELRGELRRSGHAGKVLPVG
jgi:hypothetical protein